MFSRIGLFEGSRNDHLFAFKKTIRILIRDYN
jgi:hypothetical protein